MFDKQPFLQEPVLRTRYKRAAFQKSDTNEVRISLDTNVTITREGLPQLLALCSGFSYSALTTHPSGLSTDSNKSSSGTNSSSNKSALSPVPPSSVSFPYAILEIKLANGDSCPDWVLVRKSLGMS
eukprot:1161917-Pelagomonas_calceolata.AAC.15